MPELVMKDAGLWSGRSLSCNFSSQFKRGVTRHETHLHDGQTETAHHLTVGIYRWLFHGLSQTSHWPYQFSTTWQFNTKQIDFSRIDQRGTAEGGKRWSRSAGANKIDRLWPWQEHYLPGKSSELYQSRKQCLYHC